MTKRSQQKNLTSLFGRYPHQKEIGLMLPEGPPFQECVPPGDTAQATRVCELTITQTIYQKQALEEPQELQSFFIVSILNPVSVLPMSCQLFLENPPNHHQMSVVEPFPTRRNLLQQQ
jgi:hypothetical protein